MELTTAQCEQLAVNYSVLDEIVEQLNDQPEWITEPLTMADIQAIQQGGCASGAYMPAVTYYQASATMATYGDDVLEYLEYQYGELPVVKPGESWSGMACFYLSCAIELWCAQFDLDGVDWD